MRKLSIEDSRMVKATAAHYDWICLYIEAVLL